MILLVIPCSGRDQEGKIRSRIMSKSRKEHRTASFRIATTTMLSKPNPGATRRAGI